MAAHDVGEPALARRASTLTFSTGCAFMVYTNENWSILGFSSPENARQILGGDWYVGMTESLAGGQTFGTYNVPHDPMRGQPAQVGNTVEQNGTAFDGDFGSGQLEDDESNGSIITGNDTHGTEDDED